MTDGKDKAAEPGAEGVAAQATEGMVAAASYGIRRLPAVVVDGRLADCYAGLGLDEETLTQAIVG